MTAQLKIKDTDLRGILGERGERMGKNNILTTAWEKTRRDE